VGTGAGLVALEKRKTLYPARNQTLAVYPVTRSYTDGAISAIIIVTDEKYRKCNE
jgi:hypothetical protein